MTTKLEEQFFKVFRIEPKHNKKSCKHCKYHTESNFYDGCIRDINFINCPNAKKFYPKITDRKLLQLLCIYNNMQGCVEEYFTPCRYEDTKEMVLQILIDEKTSITDYEEDTYMDVMTKQIQQLFKGKNETSMY